MEIKFSKEKPEILQALIDGFGVNWNKGVIITFGDTVYCKFKLTQQKIVHETVHVKQQAKCGVDAWWNGYFTDKDFRASQELEAYLAEKEWIVKNIFDMKERQRRIEVIAYDLSSSMYGNIVTLEEAKKIFNIK